MMREAPARPVTAAGAAGLSIVPVRSGAQLRQFIRLPWSVYRNDPAWVPPLDHDVRLALDPRRHPFHRHALVHLFLAVRGGRAVGRIAAIVNHRHIEFHGENAGFFGLFESIDDAEVAGLLLAHVEDWLRERGMEIARGPMNFSTNDELWSPGVLVDGFERAPFVLMAHTPRYYARLLEDAGYTRSKDLLAYWMHGSERERHVRMADRIMARSGFRMRPLDMRRLHRDVGIIQQIYNSAWELNWGFVPMTGEEINHLAKQLKPVVNPRLCMIAYAGEEPAGFALGLPDFNEALRHVNGRLLPLGIFKLLWYRRRIHHGRVLTLGVTPESRGKGLDALLILQLFREMNRAGIYAGECSWVLEDNTGMRNAIERTGSHVYKTWRVYEKWLVSRAR